MKIGILGGTFDPVHQGHLKLAETAKKQFHLDKVLFIPAFIPPHKTARRDITPAPYRYRMVEMAIKDEPDFEISDVELNRPDVSYTVDTLRALKKKYPAGHFYLILGIDSLAEFSTWHEPQEIRKLAEFLVARRKGFEPALPFKEGIFWLDMQEFPAASSEIRKQICEGKDISAEILPSAVAQYIDRMKLYRGAERTS